MQIVMKSMYIQKLQIFLLPIEIRAVKNLFSNRKYGRPKVYLYDVNPSDVEKEGFRSSSV